MKWRSWWNRCPWSIEYRKAEWELPITIPYPQSVHTLLCVACLCRCGERYLVHVLCEMSTRRDVCALCPEGLSITTSPEQQLDERERENWYKSACFQTCSGRLCVADISLNPKLKCIATPASSAWGGWRKSAGKLASRNEGVAMGACKCEPASEPNLVLLDEPRHGWEGVGFRELGSCHEPLPLQTPTNVLKVWKIYHINTKDEEWWHTEYNHTSKAVVRRQDSSSKLFNEDFPDIDTGSMNKKPTFKTSNQMFSYLTTSKNSKTLH